MSQPRTPSARVATGPSPSADRIRTGTLAASGAWDVVKLDPAFSPVSSELTAENGWYRIPMGADRVSIGYTYTLVGTATGAASLRPRWASECAPGQSWGDVDFDSPTVDGAILRKPAKGLQIDLPVPAGGDGDSVSDVIVLRVPPGVTHIACPAAETGDTAHKGLLDLWLLSGV